MGRQRGVVAGCVVLVLVLACADTAVGLSWSRQTLAAPTIPDGQLWGISCPSVTFCLAVGSGDSGPLAERFSAGRWTLLTVPSAAGGELTAVSCSSSTACTAVGVVPIGSSSRDAPLVERWDGRRWLHETIATKANGRVVFSGVSCPERRSCFAVGSFFSAPLRTRPVIERWNGRSWSMQRIADSGGRGRFADPTGISCTSKTACTAVGAGPSRSSIERWNGTRWQLLKSVPRLELSAVSCSSATRCVAVGVAGTRGGDVGEADTISAGRQSIVAMQSSDGEPAFSAVACASATVCLAVGSNSAGSAGSVPLLELLGHGRWSIRAAGPGDTLGGLGGVSCPARRNCTVTGGLMTFATSLTLAVHWDGSRFTTQRTPNAATPASVQLAAVSCASSAACVAVGSFTDAASVRRTLAEGWNGSRWSLQDTPNPPGTADSTLNGVSCPTTDTCIAVGFNGSQQLAERWDGIRWQIQSTPSLVGGSLLADVSCTSATACTAVSTPAESWDGTTWTVLPAPTGTLSSVSCESRSACTAVGSLTSYSPAPSTTNPLAEAWNGATWTIQTTPSPAGGGSFASVSCSAPSACTAVGASGGGNSNLAASWDGTSWSVESIPSPATAPGVLIGLSGVSCTSASDCTAVGSAESSAEALQLAYVWDGTTWTAQRLPTSAGAAAGLLSAVSCASSTACTAVGSDGLGTPIALQSS